MQNFSREVTGIWSENSMGMGLNMSIALGMGIAHGFDWLSKV